ncbi:hypothetical protein Tco_1247627 [Tanacetum coccineum]
MDTQSTQTIKLPRLQPGEYDLWKMRIEQYLQCIDYTLWEIVENGNAPIVTKTIDGKETVISPISVEEKAQRKAELKARSTLLMTLLMSDQYIRVGFEWNIDMLTMRGKKIYDELLEGAGYGLQRRKELGLTWSKVEVFNCHNDSRTREPAIDNCRLTKEEECVKDLKEQNKQLVKDLRTARISAVSYKTGLESIEARLLVFNKNESVLYRRMIVNTLKREIYLRDLDIKELKRKLDLATKEKDEVQLTVQNFENSSKSLSELLDRQIMDKCKTGLGYNVVPPPYTRNFMPPKSDLVYPSLDDFVDVNESVSEPIFEKPTIETNEPKTVRKENGAPIIEEWVSDSDKENVHKVKIVKMFNKPSFAKINFVKSTEQGNPQQDLKDKGAINSGCYRHMTGNISYLTDYKEIDGGFIAFEGNSKGGKITEKGKFDGKADEGKGPNWLFDFDALTKSMNYEPVVVGNQSNGSAGTKTCDNIGKARVETVHGKDYILLPLWTQDPSFSSSSKDSLNAGFKPSGEEEKKDAKDLGNKDSEASSIEEPRVNQEKDSNVNSTNNINTVSPIDNAVGIEDNAVDENLVYGCADDPNMPHLEEIVYSDDDEDVQRIENKAKRIKEEVYVCQPPRFEDPDFPDESNKGEKASWIASCSEELE